MSTSTDTNTIVLDRTPAKVTVVRTPCLCGCGGFPQREGARFIAGHDAKLKSLLIKAHIDNVAGITIKDGDGERVVSPMEMATELTWRGALIDAEDRAKAKAEAAKAKEAAAKAK